MTGAVGVVGRVRGAALRAALLGVGLLAARALARRLHARLAAGCERMFERMPAEFPPKRMLQGIEEIRATSARTLALIEARDRPADEDGTRAARAPAASARPETTEEDELVAAGANGSDAKGRRQR